MACPNINSQQWKELVAKIGVFEAMREFVKNGEEIPDASLYPETFKGVNATLKVVGALQKIPRTTYPSNNVQGFYNDLQKQGAPKNQIELLQNYIAQNNITEINTNDLILGLLSEMNYTVEINTSKETTRYAEVYDEISDWDNEVQFTDPNLLNMDELGPRPTQPYGVRDRNGKILQRFNDKKEAEAFRDQFNSEGNMNSQHYSSMTVPGGTNYSENEIATPAIVPSITGHAQFATDNGIGWFRSDDKVVSNPALNSFDTTEKEFQEAKSKGIKVNDVYIYNGYKYYVPLPSEFGEPLEYTKSKDIPNTGNKTRRILEVQSDLYQKSRDIKSPDEIIAELQKKGKLKIDCN